METEVHQYFRLARAFARNLCYIDRAEVEPVLTIGFDFDIKCSCLSNEAMLGKEKLFQVIRYLPYREVHF